MDRKKLGEKYAPEQGSRVLVAGACGFCSAVICKQAAKDAKQQNSRAEDRSRMAVVTPAHLEDKIKQELGAIHVEAEDLSDGCGSKFSLIVVHDGFEGQSLLERQRRVNEVLKVEMTRIHALQMKTWTRAQYEQKTQKSVPSTSQSAGEN